jgi:hypothetical protein
MQTGFKALLLSSTLLLTICRSDAQAVYTATRSSRIQAGFGGLFLNPDYSGRPNQGIGVYVDDDFGRHFGIEAEAHFGGIIAPADVGENSYLIGPRINFRRANLNLYGKIMAGRGTITNQITQGASSFGIYAYGGGLEYRVGRKFNVRPIDVEAQVWPNFYPHGLSPIAITVGIAYVIF